MTLQPLCCWFLFTKLLIKILIYSISVVTYLHEMCLLNCLSSWAVTYKQIFYCVKLFQSNVRRPRCDPRALADSAWNNVTTNILFPHHKKLKNIINLLVNPLRLCRWYFFIYIYLYPHLYIMSNLWSMIAVTMFFKLVWVFFFFFGFFVSS